jgi:2-haloalkanoic acid dehalogenase type II
VAASVDTLLSEWEAIQFRQIREPYRPYRQILRDSLAETFAAHQVKLSSEEASRLGKQIGHWQPFPDTCDTLQRLATRYKLAILSNIDDDILMQSVSKLGVKFDALFTAQQLQSYKPNPPHFQAALDWFQRPPDHYLHCAFGFKYDQAPALALGMRTVWVKRAGWIKDDQVTPTFEVASLTQLAERLGV